MRDLAHSREQTCSIECDVLLQKILGQKDKMQIFRSEYNARPFLGELLFPKLALLAKTPNSHRCKH